MISFRISECPLGGSTKLVSSKRCRIAFHAVDFNRARVLSFESEVYVTNPHFGKILHCGPNQKWTNLLTWTPMHRQLSTKWREKRSFWFTWRLWTIWRSIFLPNVWRKVNCRRLWYTYSFNNTLCSYAHLNNLWNELKNKKGPCMQPVQCPLPAYFGKLLFHMSLCAVSPNFFSSNFQMYNVFSDGHRLKFKPATTTQSIIECYLKINKYPGWNETGNC